MAATVTYDGQSPWGIYSPYVSISREPSSFGQNWYETRTIRLEGKLTKSMIFALTSSNSLEGMRTVIQNAFANNDKILKVLSSGGPFTEYNNTYVNSISFPSQRWSTMLTYSIDLTSYNFNYCSDPTSSGGYCDDNQPAIFSPTDKFDVQANEDQTVSLTHTVSASGMGGSVNQDVISWVQARLLAGANREVPGWSLEKYEYLTTSEEEKVNRFEGSYSLVRKYLIHKLGSPAATQTSPKPFVRYSAIVNEGIDQDYPTVSVEAFVKGGKGTLMSAVRTEALVKLRESNLRTVASSMLTTSGFTDTLSPTCGNYSLDEDESVKTIKAKATFEARGDEDDCRFDHEISIDIDWITGVCRVEVSGDLSCRGGVASRNASIDNFLAANTDVRAYLYGYANSAYGDVADWWTTPNAQSLNPEAFDLQITRNEKRGTLALSATYNDERYYQGYTAMRWDATAKTSVPYIKVNASGQPGTNGYWSIQSFDFSTRWKLAVNLSLTHREDANVHEPDRENAMRGALTTQKAFLFGQYGIGSPLLCLGGSPCYITSQSNNVDIGSLTSGDTSEERSFPATLPLIDINTASMLAPPQPR